MKSRTATWCANDRARRIDAGLCTMSGCPNPAIGGLMVCDYHTTAAIDERQRKSMIGYIAERVYYETRPNPLFIDPVPSITAAVGLAEIEARQAKHRKSEATTNTCVICGQAGFDGQCPGHRSPRMKKKRSQIDSKRRKIPILTQTT